MMHIGMHNSLLSLGHRCKIYNSPQLWRSLYLTDLVRGGHLCSTASFRSGHVCMHTESNMERGIGITQAEQRKLLRKKPVQPADPRILRVAIIGCPNAGKSTLANQIMGWRFSSVSEKVHTTRQKSIGILTEGNTQVVFLDTPGLITPKKRKKHGLERSLLTDPHSSLFEADLIAVVTDISTRWGRNYLDQELLKALYVHKDTKSILILNKTDCIQPKRKLLKTTRHLTEGIVGGRRDSHEIKKSLDPLEEIEKLLRSNSSLSREPRDAGHVENNGDCEVNMDVLNETEISSNDITHRGHNGHHPNVNEIILEGGQTLHGAQNQTRSHSLDAEKCLEINERTSSLDFGALNNHDGDISERLSHVVTSDTQDCHQVADTIETLTPSVGDKMQALPHQWSPEVWQLYHHQLQHAQKAVRNKEGWPHFDEVFMVSALHGDGVEELKDYLISAARPGRWKYHSALITDQDPLEIACLCIREKCLDEIPDEVPYNLEVRVVLWEVDENGMLWTSFDIVCERKRHLFSTLGKGGATLRAIAGAAKQDLMNTFQTELSLKLSVRLKGSI